MISSNCLVELTVPSDRQMMLVIRLTTVGVIARSGLTVDAMDDVKMAVEEACNCLFRSSRCARLRLGFWIEGSDFKMRAEALACDACPPGEGFVSTDEIDVIRCVLLSMMDGAALTYDGCSLRAIELRKRLPS